MKLGFLFISVRDLKSKKLRSVITIVGIAGIITSYIVMIAAANTMDNLVEETFSAYEYRLFVLKRGKEDPMVGQMPDWYVNKIRRVVDSEYISGVSGFLWWQVDNSTTDEDTEFITIRGVQVESYKSVIEKYQMIAGDDLSDAQKDHYKCMIGINVAEKYGKTVGDEVVLKNKTFTIKGIFSTEGVTDSEIWLTLRDAQNLVGRLHKVSIIIVKINKLDYVDEVRKQIEDNLRGVVVFKADEYMEANAQALESFRGIILAISMIALLTAILGIMNTMTMTLRERRHDTAIMKAVGVSNKSIALIYSVEALFLGFLGGIVGVLFGFAMLNVFGMTNFELAGYLIRIELSLQLALESVLISTILGVTGGLYPIVKVSRQRALDLLMRFG
jgi:ABC-type lipoprotein release transport system permease subunit